MARSCSSRREIRGTHEGIVRSLAALLVSGLIVSADQGFPHGAWITQAQPSAGQWYEQAVSNTLDNDDRASSASQPLWGLLTQSSFLRAPTAWWMATPGSFSAQQCFPFLTSVRDRAPPGDRCGAI
ncbi:MAG: hypothetical protein AB7G75_20030 [Candidatus Binatia bacterium]